MGKAALITTNYTGGELSPFLLGRVDVAKYANGAAVMENFHPVVQGGALTRPGTRFTGFAKGPCRLIPFVFSRAVAYQVELGFTTTGYLRIWRVSNKTLVGVADGGSKVPPRLEKPNPYPTDTTRYDFATPYTADEISEVTYEQAEDTLFLFHYAHPPQRLQRQADQVWRFEPMPFVAPPFAENGYSSSVALTLSDKTSGTGRVFTAASGEFLPADVGREIHSGTGVAMLTAYTDSTHVTATVTSDFLTTAIESWSLSESPQALVYINQKEPVGSIVNLDAAVTRNANVTLSSMSGTITITADAPVFLPSDNTRAFVADAGLGVITYTDSTHLSVVTSSDFLRKSYQPGSWGIGSEAWRSTDVGGYVRINGGLLQITGYTNQNRLSAKIINSPSALVAATPGAWSLESNSFGANGYPRCGALHEQRLYIAGSVAEPQTIWASRIAEYLDFTPGLNDDDGFTYTLATNQRNAIGHLVSGARLFALTAGQEHSLRGGNEKAMGPTNIQRSNESAFGSNTARPVPIAKEAVFVQGSGRKVRALGYSAAIDSFDSPDRTVFAEHVTQSGVVEMTYQPQAHSLLYAVREDGQMAVSAYDVGQEVVAWSRYVTDGQFRSVSCVPNVELDEVWVVVQRQMVNGTAYVVEVFEDALSTDCAGNGVDGFGRFADGTSLSVKRDDIYQGQNAVSAGAIAVTLLPGSLVEAGLPFTATLELLPPDLGGGSTVQGSNLSVHEIVVRLLDTKTFEINGEVSDFRQFGANLLDQPPPGFTGDARAIHLTDDLYRDKLVIRQPLPYKAHVLAVIRKLTANDV